VDGALWQVQALMGCLVYAGRLDRSPYSGLLSEALWREAADALYVDGCRLLDLPIESPLSVLFRAGLLAVPPLQKMKSVVVGSKGDWNTLPVSNTCDSKELEPRGHALKDGCGACP
jgi:E3 ubiquitin-protein transferase RMND5